MSQEKNRRDASSPQAVHWKFASDIPAIDFFEDDGVRRQRRSYYEAAG